MNILYSHRTKSADGQYVHIRSLTEALAARGHRIVMAGPDDFGAPRARSLDASAGATGLRARLPRPLYEAAEILYSARGFQRLAAAARMAKPDILYERYNLFYHAGAPFARGRRLPFILEVNAPLAEERAAHGGLAFRRLARMSEQSIWRAADHVLPVTGVLARTVEQAGVRQDKVTVIHNGVSADFLRDRDSRPVRARFGLESKIVLGFTGFVRDWHRVDLALRYIAERRRSDLHLLLVGDGDSRAALERLAEDLGIRAQFTATGVVQHDELPDYISAFDIALQPAVVPYASPLKLFEYMALGRAIVAPASENIREVLTDSEQALLFLSGDASSFASTLDALVDDRDRRERLGAAARAMLIRRDLTWAGNAARVEAIARNLLERKR
jgi:glycosyltransferase involved in cell wall biosynthesis